MDETEASYIKLKMPELMRSTKCSRSLLAELQSKDVISDSDVDELMTKNLSDFDKAVKLYDILLTKTGGFKYLTDSLLSEEQNDAYYILQGIETYREEYHWKKLTNAEKEKAKRKPVKFQNKTTTLKQFDHPSDLAIPPELLKGDFLRALLHYEYPELIQLGVPTIKHDYICRVVSSKRFVSQDIFKNPGQDVFVISHIDLFRLGQMGLTEVEESTSQIYSKVITASLIKLAYEEDYDEICKLTSRPVHLLSHAEGRFEWIKTTGTLQLIQKYMSNNQEQKGMTEDEFLKRSLSSKTPICIADTPGMGKTVFLKKIGEQIMVKYPLAIVKYIKLSELNQNAVVTLESVCKLIAAGSSKYDIGNEMVSNALQMGTLKSYLLLDGYDELQGDQLETTNNILQLLMRLPNTQLYVSTRSHMRQELELLLGVLGYTLQPFQEQDQKEFLVNYWKKDDVAKRLSSESLFNFASVCLQKLKEVDSKFENGIAGIPLQCKLLGDVHLRQAQDYARRNLGPSDMPKTASSIFEMYRQHVQLSFDKLDSVAVDCKYSIMQVHMFFAIQELYPKQSPKFVQFCNGIVPREKFKSLIYETGILEKVVGDERPRFVHRTFAEFLVAMFMAQFVGSTIQAVREPVAELLFRKILKTTPFPETVLQKTWFIENAVTIDSHRFNNPVVCYFLDCLVKTRSNLKIDNVISLVGCGPPRSSVLASNKHLLTYSPKAVEMFTAAACLDIFQLTSLLQILLKSKELPWSTLRLLVAKKRGNEVADQLVELMKNVENIDIAQMNFPIASSSLATPAATMQIIITPLHVAAQNGNFTMMMQLLQDIHFQTALSSKSKKGLWLLHLVVSESYNDTADKIDGKKDIVKFLCTESSRKSSQYRHILEETLPNGVTPLLQKRVHIELLNCLIEVGANINALTNEQECLLHTFIKERDDVSAAQYHRIVKQLVDLDFQRYEQCSAEGETPLAAAIKTLELLPKTVNLFAEKGVTLQPTNQPLDIKIVQSAVRGGRSPKFVEQLCQQGGSSLQDTEVGKVAFREATTSVNVDVVSYMVETVSASVLNAADQEGNTPLHEAMSKNTEHHEEMQVKMINAGADLEKENSNELTPLVYAFQEGKGVTLRTLQAVELVQPEVISSSANNCLEALLKSENIRTWEWNNEVISVGEYFVNAGAELKTRTGHNPWSEGQHKSSNISNIAESTECNEQLLVKLETSQALDSTVVSTIKKSRPESKANVLYGILPSVSGSYERIMLSLISCHQEHPFLMLKKWLQDPDFDTNAIVKPTMVPVVLTDITFDDDVNDDEDIESSFGKDFIQNENQMSLSFSDGKGGITEALNRKVFKGTLPEKLDITKAHSAAATHIDFSKPLQMNTNGQPVSQHDSFDEMLDHPAIGTYDSDVTDTIVPGSKHETHTDGDYYVNSFQKSRKFHSPLQRTPPQHGNFNRQRNETPVEVDFMEYCYPFMILRRTLVSKLIFEHFVGDVLVFVGIGFDELTSLAKWGQRVGHANQSIGHYVAAESESEFDKIVEDSIGAVHLIEYSSAEFYLVKSHGSTNNISRFLEGNLLERVNIDEFFSMQPFAYIVQVPTALLCNQLVEAASLKIKESKLIYVELSKVLNTFINHAAADNNTLNAENILAHVIDGHRYKLRKSGSKIQLVLSVQMDILLENWNKLDKLQEFFAMLNYEPIDNIQVWIFTDELSISKIEELSGISGFELRGFDRGQIIKLIGQFCGGEAQFSSAESCLAEYENKVTCTLPIHCNEIISQLKVCLHSPAHNPILISFLLARRFGGGGSVEIGSLTELCNSLFRGNYSLAHFAYIIKISRYSSLTNVLKDVDLNSEHKIPEIEGCSEYIINEIASFYLALLLVHKQFEQYLIVDRMSEVISGILFLVEEKETGIYVFKYPSLCYFVNELLAHNSELFEKMLDAVTLESVNQEALLQAIVTGSHHNILKAVLPCLNLTTRFNDNLVGLAVMLADKDTISCVCRGHNKAQLEDISMIYKNEQWSLMQLAVHRGEFSVIEYLISILGFGEDMKNKALLHYCLWGSSKDDNRVITDKIKVIKMIFQKLPGLAEERISGARSSLAMWGIHLSLIKLLAITLNVGISALNQKGSTLLQTAAEYLSPSKYHTLVTMFIREQKTGFFKSVDSEGRGVLHSAVINFDVMPETLLIFKSHDLDFNAIANKRFSVLYFAVEKRRSAAVINTLIECGANWQEKRENDNSLLHAAAQFGNLSAIHVLQSGKQKVNINIKNHSKFEATPLHFALHGEAKFNLLETVRTLVEFGADVNAKRQDDGQTPLIYAVQKNKSPNLLDTLHYLICRGADVNVVDNNERTMFDYARDRFTRQEFQLIAKTF